MGGKGCARVNEPEQHKRSFETAPPKNVYGITFLPGRRVYTRVIRNGSGIVIARSAPGI